MTGRLQIAYALIAVVATIGLATLWVMLSRPGRLEKRRRSLIRARRAAALRASATPDPLTP